MGRRHEIVPASAEIKALWPDTSGNEINRLDQAAWRQPKPVFWRLDDSIAHGAVLRYFYQRYRENEKITSTRKLYDKVRDIPEGEVRTPRIEKSTEEWVQDLKAAALSCGADVVGICAYDPQWTFDDRPQPAGTWAIVLGFQHDHVPMLKAPHEDAYAEVMMQYARAGATAKKLANWIRDKGHGAWAKTGPMTEDVLMIPAAIAAGLGELGKHGSIIHRDLGSSFRLSIVLTDLPLKPDQPDVFGADEFCSNCQICTNACPPDAIAPEKQMVNGEEKWYVDFDKCLPYFIDHETCGICVAVCPWSRPGIAENLLQKMARRKRH